jgi:O-antigen/teichoic acid export membrane protein
MAATSDRSFLFRNFSVLFTGLLLVQIINFFFSLILPKYFSPQEFAEFGIFTSIVFMLIEIVNAKLDIAVMLPQNTGDSIKLVSASITMAIILASLVAVCCIPAILFYNKIYALLPFTILLYGINQPILVYLNKVGMYPAINYFRIIQVLFTCIFTITLGIFQIPHSLILGFFTGLLFATIYTVKFIRPAFNVELLKEQLRQYHQFPKYGTWSSLLNNISRNSVPLLLIHFFSNQLVGFYSYSTRLLNAPTGMYSSALGQVYFKAASDQNKEQLKSSTRKMIRTTFIVSILPSLIILCFGKEIFFALFSGEWLEAGKISQYLILWYFLGVITSPISGVLDIKQKLRFEFYFNCILFLARLFSLIIGGIMHDFYLSILLFVISGITMNLFLLYYINFILLEE